MVVQSSLVEVVLYADCLGSAAGELERHVAHSVGDYAGHHLWGPEAEALGEQPSIDGIFTGNVGSAVRGKVQADALFAGDEVGGMLEADQAE